MAEKFYLKTRPFGLWKPFEHLLGVEGVKAHQARAFLRSDFTAVCVCLAGLGGVDVHLFASATEEEVRHRCRQILAACGHKPRFAFGSGNTIANYCKMENVLAMFDEALIYKV